MTQKIDAIFENGVLRPLQELRGLCDHTRVKISVEIPDQQRNGLTDCVGTLPDEDAAEMLGIIENEFERVNARDWE